MSEPITYEEGEYGLRAVVRSEWNDAFLKELTDRKIRELELNDGKGWRGDNIEFLEYLPKLKSLIILHLTLESVTPIHFLTGLINLNLTTYSDTPVDFEAFPDLKECWFEWIKGSDALFRCRSLRGLGINSYDKKSSGDFSALCNLERLAVLNSKLEDLEGIFKLRSLKYLSLARLRKIASIQGVEKLVDLEELEIQSCRSIHSVSEIFNLRKLKRLSLVNLGDIGSIRGIANLINLEELFFYESTNVVDGDLSEIPRLKKLTKISFQNRKHYTHRREDFWQY